MEDAVLKTLGLGEQLSLCFSSITAVPLSQKGFPPEQLMPLEILAFCPDREHPEGEGLLWRAESSMRDVQLGATRFQGLIWRPVFYRDNVTPCCTSLGFKCYKLYSEWKECCFSALLVWETALCARALQAGSVNVQRLVSNNWHYIMGWMRKCCGCNPAALACMMLLVPGWSSRNPPCSVMFSDTVWEM